MIVDAVVLTIGFTGTRAGMQVKQKQKIREFLFTFWNDGFRGARHGMCTGSDEDFHNLCRIVGYHIIGHPGVNAKGGCPTRAEVICDEVMQEEPFLVRDRHIVDGTDVLVATPRSFEEEFSGSGTWATIRYARKSRRPHHVVYPNGATSSTTFGGTQCRLMR